MQRGTAQFRPDAARGPAGSRRSPRQLRGPVPDSMNCPSSLTLPFNGRTSTQRSSCFTRSDTSVPGGMGAGRHPCVLPRHRAASHRPPPPRTTTAPRSPAVDWRPRRDARPAASFPEGRVPGVSFATTPLSPIGALVPWLSGPPPAPRTNGSRLPLPVGRSGRYPPGARPPSPNGERRARRPAEHEVKAFTGSAARSAARPRPAAPPGGRETASGSASPRPDHLGIGGEDDFHLHIIQGQRHRLTDRHAVAHSIRELEACHGHSRRGSLLERQAAVEWRPGYGVTRTQGREAAEGDEHA